MRQNASYLERLIKLYGTTDNPGLGGFLLPDGSFLDFSEGSGMRSQDHRNIIWVLRSSEEKGESRYDAMVRVAKRVGMYRWMPESWSLETWTAPTAAQSRAIEMLVEHKSMSIEAYDGNRHHFSTYEPWESDTAVVDLRWFYRGGKVKRNPSTDLLFSYGSNGKHQLSVRLGRKVEVFPAYAEGWRRVFRGHSSKWGGGVASLIRRQGVTTYGNVSSVGPQDIQVLDAYEGVSSGKYARKRIQVVANLGDGWKVCDAWAYLSTSRQQNDPSDVYLAAVAQNVGQLWAGSRGNELKASDFYNED
jgi:hypothetical protein